MSKSELRKSYEARFGAVVGVLRLYDDKGNQIYYDSLSGYWQKYEYDADGNVTYYETSRGYWEKYQFYGKEIYYENSKEGVIRDKQPCDSKVFIDEKSGKKFKLTEIK